MISDLIQLTKDHGPLAVMLVTICAYHFWWTKSYRKERDSVREEHREERREWLESQKNMQKETTTVVRDNNKALRELTKVIAESNSGRNKAKKT